MAAARGHRTGFVLRLMLALAAALGVVGVAQYAAVGHTLTSTAMDDLKAAHAADATVLRDLHDAEGGGMVAVAELLGHIASRPGVESVVLRDAAGAETLVGQPAAHGGRMADMGEPHDAAMGGTDASHDADTGATDEAPVGTDAHAPTGAEAHGATDGSTTGHGSADMGGGAEGDESAGTGDATEGHGDAGTEGATELAPVPAESGAVEAAGLITVSVPVELGGQPFALEVQRDDAELRASVEALRRVVLITLAGGLLLVLPLFYVVGGRSLASTHREALEGSTTDGLTGLGNHRLFHDDLRRAVSHAHRHGRELTLVLIDLDGFKQVNDTHGHARGDQVLGAVGAVLREGRGADNAYRIGGDEFALLLSETDVAGALATAQRIRGRVEQEVEGVTTSIGVAGLGVAWPDGPSLLRAADAALYLAKGEGRNRVVPAQAMPETTAAHV